MICAISMLFTVPGTVRRIILFDMGMKIAGAPGDGVR